MNAENVLFPCVIAFIQGGGVLARKQFRLLFFLAFQDFLLLHFFFLQPSNNSMCVIEKSSPQTMQKESFFIFILIS